MKKLFTILLALTLVFASFSVAFADDLDPNTDILGNTASKEIEFTGVAEQVSRPVKVFVNPQTGGGEVYKVNVAWGTLTFTYNKGQASTWNPDTHTTDSVGASWSNNTADIVVTNHSNVKIDYKASFNDQDDSITTITTNNITATLTAENGIDAPQGTLESDAANGDGEGPGNVCPAGTIKLKLDVQGTPPDGETTVGTIYITVSKNNG